MPEVPGTHAAVLPCAAAGNTAHLPTASASAELPPRNEALKF